MVPFQTLCSATFSLLRAAFLLPFCGGNSNWTLDHRWGTLQSPPSFFHLQQKAGYHRYSPIQQLLLRIPMEQIVQSFWELDELRLQRDIDGGDRSENSNTAAPFHHTSCAQPSAWRCCTAPATTALMTISARTSPSKPNCIGKSLSS